MRSGVKIFFFIIFRSVLKKIYKKLRENIVNWMFFPTIFQHFTHDDFMKQNANLLLFLNWWKNVPFHVCQIHSAICVLLGPLCRCARCIRSNAALVLCMRGKRLLLLCIWTRTFRANNMQTSFAFRFHTHTRTKLATSLDACAGKRNASATKTTSSFSNMPYNTTTM